MAFDSVLFPGPCPPAGAQKPPACFRDLQLDRVVAGVAACWKDHEVAAYFYAPLNDVEAVAYRQEVARELGRDDVMMAVRAFAGAMHEVRVDLDAAKRQHDYRYESERWLVHAAECYCDGIDELRRALAGVRPTSRGLAGLSAYLDGYVASAEYVALARDARNAATDLAQLRFALLLQPGSATAQPFVDAPDYTVVVEETFERFRRGSTKDYRAQLADTHRLTAFEAQLLDGIAELHPEPFRALDAFAAAHPTFVDATIERFDREVPFYVAYHNYLAPLRRAGLPFCYPRVSATSKETACTDTFDLALAAKLVAEGSPVVLNDLALHGTERIFVVSGPNQGGKTTFARTFGQLHYLAALGLPVPGAEAQLLLCDRVFTHFEREEKVTKLRSKLEDDLLRIHEILETATRRSVVVINEMFASTTLEDAVALARCVMGRLSELDVLATWVTFLDELATFDARTVSVTSTVDPADPAVRTFRVVRAPATGVAYALTIAAKYGVTYERLKERIRP